MSFEIKALDHVSIIVKDVDASRKFYCGVFGMEEVERPKNFTFDGAWFRKGGAEIHLVTEDEAVQAPGDSANNPTEKRDLTFARHFALQINDMDGLVDALKEHDMELVFGPRQRGDGPLQAYIYDPDGHMIEITEKP
jgi:catechol 2,3-dioxygenase-like lactoylglutathione lyase family enzyme